MLRKKILILLALVLGLGFLAGCGNKEELETIRLGVNSDEDEVWKLIASQLREEGVRLEIISFGDYTRPNLALAEGEIDLNAFQHYAFFNKFKEEHGLDLTAIGETVIAPLGIYSKKIESLGELDQGATIALPNDESNLARGLVLLERAGLLELEKKELPGLKDIRKNSLDLEIKELDASIIARALEDVDAAIINSGFAVDSGLNPREDSIFLEPIDEASRPYINIIAARTEDRDREIFKKIVSLYQTDEVEELIDEIYGGGQEVAW